MASQANRNALAANRSSWNAGYRFGDAPTGAGTEATANGYDGNGSVGNAAGASDPPGLCP